MAARFWVGGTGTWDASTTTNWAASSGGAGGETVPGSGDTVTFDGSSGGGTVTVNTTVNVTSITMGAFTGTLDFATNDNNVTLVSWSGTGSGTRTLNMGDGTWTITGTTGTVFTNQTSTNFTMNANGSTLLITAALTGTRTIDFGSRTYNIVTLVDTSGLSLPTDLFGACTIATLNLTPPVHVRGAPGVSHTVTNAINWAGTAYNSVIQIGTSSTTGVNAQFPLTGGGTMAWATFRSVTFTGSPVASNSFDLGDNSGITINGPSGGGGGGQRVIGAGN